MITLLILLVIAFVTVKAYGPAKVIDGALRCVFSYRDILKQLPDGTWGLYLRRFFITPKRWIGFRPDGSRRWPRVLGFVPVRFRKIFLHRILLDDDRTKHDHPWPFDTHILAGGYREFCLTPGGKEYTRLAMAGTHLRNEAEHTHRVAIIKPVWSLVFAGEAYRDWGFWVPDMKARTCCALKWVDWRTFLNLPNAPTEPEDQFPGDTHFTITEET